MKLKLVSILLLSAGLASGSAQAGDEELFHGLIPGVPLAEEELQEFYGTGADLTLTGELVNVFGEIDLSQDVAQWFTMTNNGGITTGIPVVGDNNDVDVTVILNVNIGTVSIIDPVGSSINASAVVDFGGVVDFGLNR
jgi:hypothetical protein